MVRSTTCAMSSSPAGRCEGGLTDDYLEPAGVFERAFVNRSREAPAVFRHEGKYFIITSGCTGWDPNAAEYAVAMSIMGPWKVMGNPCRGPLAGRTFNAQSSFVLPVAGKPGAFIFMADRWNRDDLGDSRYVWLPMRVGGRRCRLSGRKGGNCPRWAGFKIGRVNVVAILEQCVAKL